MSRIFAYDSSPMRRPEANGSNKPKLQSHTSIDVNGNPKWSLNGYSRTKFGSGSRSRSPEQAHSSAAQRHEHEQRRKQSGAGPSHSGTTASTSNKLSHSINARSLGALSTAGHAKGSDRSRSASDDSGTTSPAAKRHKFSAALKPFEYKGPGATEVSSITIEDDDESSLSDLSAAEAQLHRTISSTTQPKKKRKFVRAKQVTSSDVEEADTQEVNTPSTSVSSRRSDIPTIDPKEFEIKAKRIISIRRTATIEEAKKALIDSNFEPAATLKLLDERLASRRPQPSSPVSITSSPPVKQTAASVDLTRSPNASTSSPVAATRSLIPGRPGIQVSTKKVPASGFYRHSASPAPTSNSIAKKLGSSRPAHSAVQRIKAPPRGTRSEPTTDDNDGMSSDDEYDPEQAEEQRALDYFNNKSEQKLVDITGITMEQAKIIVTLRPFDSTSDLRRKLQITKDVKPHMFFDCVGLMAGLERIDSVLDKCEKMGKKISDALKKFDTPGGDPEYLDKQPKGAKEGIALHDFQMHGVNWMFLLYRKKCSGILADDMGLGKTAQVISFLNHIVGVCDTGPHLIVVPGSVLTNWEREFAVFGTKLRVHTYYGPQRERAELQMDLQDMRDEIDVILTTYDIASGQEFDHKFLRKFSFDAIVFDEGHILKNPKAAKHEKLKRIKGAWKLLLTGTPLQNNLSELITLLRFIMPEYFRGAEDALSQIFKSAQQSQLADLRVERAKLMMRPFVLRRKKIDVLHALKSKTETVKYCNMTKDQTAIYRATFASSRKALIAQRETDKATDLGAPMAKTVTPIKIGALLMALRKAANHPLLFRRLYDDAKIDALARDYLRENGTETETLQMKKEDFAINSDAELCISIAMEYPACEKHVLDPQAWLNSGKIAAMKEVIDEAAQKGERVVIFSMFVQTLEIICRALEVMGVTYRGFTGSTGMSDRQQLVDEFTRDKSISCFLLSTRAGGVGINLVAANWVIFYDQDYNPQMDQQAADRCYRMGQEKPVTVVRLISRNTIDEQIHELGRSKLRLADRVQGEKTVLDDDEGEVAGMNNADAMEKKVEQSLLNGILAGNEKMAGTTPPPA